MNLFLGSLKSLDHSIFFKEEVFYYENINAFDIIKDIGSDLVYIVLGDNSEGLYNVNTYDVREGNLV